VVVFDVSAPGQLGSRLPALAWQGRAIRTALTFPLGEGFVGATWQGQKEPPTIGHPRTGWSLADSSLFVVSGELPGIMPRFEIGVPHSAARALADARVASWRTTATLAALTACLGVLLVGRTRRSTHLKAAERALADSQLRAAQAEMAAARAGLAAVQARLNPHFLSNALHSVAGLIAVDTQAAEDAIDRLGDLFRYTVEQSEQHTVCLSSEWRFAQDYLAIEQMRLGDRLVVKTELDPSALKYEVPPFSLQPLVENAIRHGIGPRPGQGTVWVCAQHTGDRLELSVEDDGLGANPAAVAASTGTGLRALRQRLALDAMFDGHVIVDTAPTRGFCVRVTMLARETLATSTPL
jgi:signal transduction histidine kinase